VRAPLAEWSGLTKAWIAKHPPIHRADDAVWVALWAAPRPFTNVGLSRCPTFQGEALQRVAGAAILCLTTTPYRGVGVGRGV
jgi:hypothetical protein